MSLFGKALDFLDPGDVYGFQQDRRVSNANAAIKQAQEKADAASNANKDLYNQFYNKTQSTYGDTAAKVDDYLKNLEGMEAYNPGQFSYTGDVNDFYSKAADLRVKNAMNALRESSDIFSSDYQDAMAAKQQALASEEWDKAYDRYMRDRSQTANEWQMNANAGQQAYDNTYGKNKDLLSVAQNAQDNLMNAYGNYINNIANQNNVDTQNYSNMVQQIAANQNSKKGMLGRILG
ncbi:MULTISPECIES: hypothetical protein [Bacteria]|uniref:hypothetical protein n=1 Tax=Bacteria TaxID=2 RepID=UPI000B10CD95|nr:MULTISPECIES: hypothetical protein [Bacteria]